MLRYATPVVAAMAGAAIASCASVGVAVSVSMAAEISDTTTVWRKRFLFMMNPSVCLMVDVPPCTVAYAAIRAVTFGKSMSVWATLLT